MVMLPELDETVAWSVETGCCGAGAPRVVIGTMIDVPT